MLENPALTRSFLFNNQFIIKVVVLKLPQRTTDNAHSTVIVRQGNIKKIQRSYTIY